jgi:alkylation response protein AidB-like acyl-CoA dehydrogenase
MDVRLSPEQQALRDSTAQIVDRLGPKAVGQLDDRERAEKLEAAVAATGWRDLRADEGGAPLAGGTEVALVAEEMARGLADAAFIGPTLAAELRRLAGLPAADQAETVLLAPGLGALSEVAPGDAPDGLAFDSSGAASALALVPGPDGYRIASVDLAGAVEPGEAVDMTRRVARPDAPAALVEGAAPLSGDAHVRWVALGLAVTSADLVGIMQGALDLANTYACERRQYGAPIGSFQAVQHLLADALVSTEGSRSAALHAAWAVDALPPDAALAAAAAAKAYASRAVRAVCETSIQVHGGIGNTWECLAHVFLRRALLSAELFGGVDACLEQVLRSNGIR